MPKPPQENYIIAGPSAERDIDYETVYGPGRAGPSTSRLLPSLENVEAPGPPEVMKSARNEQAGKSVSAEPGKNRRVIRAVSVLPVTGSTAEHNREITAAMREVLKSAGWPVLVQPREDAFTITGQLSLGARENGFQRIKMAWTISSFDGRDLGKLEQSNNISVRSVDGAWKQTAFDIASAAGMGIFELVGKLR